MPNHLVLPVNIKVDMESFSIQLLSLDLNHV